MCLGNLHTASFAIRPHISVCLCLVRALQQLPQLLAAVQHATFQRVLAPLLLPCLAAVTQQLLQPYAHSDPKVRAVRQHSAVDVNS